MQVICNVHMYKVDKFYFISYLGCFFAAVNPMFRLSAFKLGLKSKKLWKNCADETYFKSLIIAFVV